MRLRSLNLHNFKNYRDLRVDFAGSNVFVLVGKNGQGKTNLLEAIFILALTKSYQTVALRELINWHEQEKDTGLPEYFRIAGSVETLAGEKEMEVLCGKARKYPKTLKINAVKKKPRDYVGNLRVVLFTPQDMNMIMLAPKLRRQYVNILLSQIDSSYLDNLSEYQLLIRQRNKLLERIRDGYSRILELEYWDKKIIKTGAYVLWKRRELFESLNQLLSDKYREIASDTVDFMLQWNKNWGAGSLEEIRELFDDYILEKQGRDIEVGRTCGGPHREDFIFRMRDRNLAEFGSRGECRTAILALKLAELTIIKEKTGDCPILLFDDVFSELDLDRQQNLLQLFQADQVFISSTHLDYEVDAAKVFRVEDGRLLDGLGYLDGQVFLE